MDGYRVDVYQSWIFKLMIAFTDTASAANKNMSLFLKLSKSRRSTASYKHWSIKY